jgi:hypothetical protein
MHKGMKMNFKKIYTWWFVLILALSGCATVTQDQALKTVKSKYPEGVFIYVDASSNELSNALIVTSLKLTSSTTSDALVPMLLLSNKTLAVVAGKSDMVTAATIRRAIEDAGPSLPANGQLVIVGEPKDFEEMANFARSRGLNVDVMPPVQKDGSPPIVNEPVTIAPSADPTMRLQDQVQKDSNAQMNQLLRGSARK